MWWANEWYKNVNCNKFYVQIGLNVSAKMLNEKFMRQYFQLKYPISLSGIDFACSIKPWFAVVDVFVPDIIKVSGKW